MKKDTKQDNFLSFMRDILYRFWIISVRVILIALLIVTTYEMPDVFAWNETISNYTNISNNFYTDNKYNADTIEMLDDFIEELPPAFVKEFRNCWRVIIEDCNTNTVSYHNGNLVGGYTHWQSRTIYVKEQEKFDSTLEIFIHELGHCFDFEYGSVSYSNWFDEIYQLYKDNFKEQYTSSPDGYSTSSVEEFFATCFEEYILCPEHLKENAPKAYNFINSFYEKVSEIKHIYLYDFGAVANTILRLASDIQGEFQ